SPYSHQYRGQVSAQPQERSLDSSEVRGQRIADPCRTFRVKPVCPSRSFQFALRNCRTGRLSGSLNAVSFRLLIIHPYVRVDVKSKLQFDVSVKLVSSG